MSSASDLLAQIGGAISAQATGGPQGLQAFMTTLARREEQESAQAFARESAQRDQLFRMGAQRRQEAHETKLQDDRLAAAREERDAPLLGDARIFAAMAEAEPRLGQEWNALYPNTPLTHENLVAAGRANGPEFLDGIVALAQTRERSVTRLDEAAVAAYGAPGLARVRAMTPADRPSPEAVAALESSTLAANTFVDSIEGELTGIQREIQEAEQLPELRPRLAALEAAGDNIAGLEETFISGYGAQSSLTQSLLQETEGSAGQRSQGLGPRRDSLILLHESATKTAVGQLAASLDRSVPVSEADLALFVENPEQTKAALSSSSRELASSLLFIDGYSEATLTQADPESAVLRAAAAELEALGIKTPETENDLLFNVFQAAHAAGEQGDTDARDRLLQLGADLNSRAPLTMQNNLARHDHNERVTFAAHGALDRTLANLPFDTAGFGPQELAAFDAFLAQRPEYRAEGIGEGWLGEEGMGEVASEFLATEPGIEWLFENIRLQNSPENYADAVEAFVSTAGLGAYESIISRGLDARVVASGSPTAPWAPGVATATFQQSTPLQAPALDRNEATQDLILRATIANDPTFSVSNAGLGPIQQEAWDTHFINRIRRFTGSEEPEAGTVLFSDLREAASSRLTDISSLATEVLDFHTQERAWLALHPHANLPGGHDPDSPAARPENRDKWWVRRSQRVDTRTTLSEIIDPVAWEERGFFAVNRASPGITRLRNLLSEAQDGRYGYVASPRIALHQKYQPTYDPHRVLQGDSNTTYEYRLARARGGPSADPAMFRGLIELDLMRALGPSPDGLSGSQVSALRRLTLEEGMALIEGGGLSQLQLGGVYGERPQRRTPPSVKQSRDLENLRNEWRTIQADFAEALPGAPLGSRFEGEELFNVPDIAAALEEQYAESIEQLTISRDASRRTEAAPPVNDAIARSLVVAGLGALNPQEVSNALLQDTARLAFTGIPATERQAELGAPSPELEEIVIGGELVENPAAVFPTQFGERAGQLAEHPSFEEGGMDAFLALLVDASKARRQADRETLGVADLAAIHLAVGDIKSDWEALLDEPNISMPHNLAPDVLRAMPKNFASMLPDARAFHVVMARHGGLF